MDVKYMSRKYQALWMCFILTFIGMVVGLIAAINNISIPWLSVTLPILAAGIPAYMGANSIASLKGKK